jgi:hypothetical protein
MKNCEIRWIGWWFGIITTIGLRSKEKQIDDNLENGEEYTWLTLTPYQNLMLDRWNLRTKEKPTWHRSFLPQEVVWCEIWIESFQRKHSYKQRSPWKEMQLTTHLNEWVQYILSCNLWFKIEEIKMEQGVL